MPVYLPLPESGPVFAYLKWQNERWLLVETASGGQARQEFSLPPEAYFDDLQTALSPDGRTLAFYSGQPPGPPYDLALNLLDLQSGQVTRLTALLSVDYPDNFQELAGFLAQSSEREPTSAEDLRQTFILGIYSLAWSPDGRFLAFAGQMQGLSSDIYLYDVRTRFIQRLIHNLLDPFRLTIYHAPKGHANRWFPSR